MKIFKIKLLTNLKNMYIAVYCMTNIMLCIALYYFISMLLLLLQNHEHYFHHHYHRHYVYSWLRMCYKY